MDETNDLNCWRIIALRLDQTWVILMTEETTEALTQEEKKIPTRRNLDMIKLAPEIEGVEIEILNFDD